MGKCIAAHTSLAPIYPGYINASIEDDGTVVVTVRGDPMTGNANGAFICGYAADKGKPGRCTPGDEHCNNYCNMAPQKGPMQDHPARCTQTFECATVAFRMSKDEWEAWASSAVAP